MAGLGPNLLAFTVAIAVTALELLTTKYPRTAAFVCHTVWFYVYIVIYGAIAAIALALLPVLGAHIQSDGINLMNPWIAAAAVGISVKSLLHIRIFNVSTGPGKDLPVGLETIVLLFDTRTR